MDLLNNALSPVENPLHLGESPMGLEGDPLILACPVLRHTPDTKDGTWQRES